MQLKESEKLELKSTFSEIYKQARSVPRNKLVMRIFHEYGLIENWGTGFQRMLKLCRENGNPDPVFF